MNFREINRRGIILLLVLAFAAFSAVRCLTTPVRASDAPSVPTKDELVIDPSVSFSLPVQEVDVKVGETFVINIAVGNARDMYAWQVYMQFDPAKIECVKVSYTRNYVLSPYVTVSGSLGSTDTGFIGGPLQCIRNDEGWVLAGDAQLGANQPTFSGSGTLCQMEFRAISSGSSAIALLHDTANLFQTYILDPNIEARTASAVPFLNVLAQ